LAIVTTLATGQMAAHESGGSEVGVAVAVAVGVADGVAVGVACACAVQTESENTPQRQTASIGLNVAVWWPY
jgi:hypothetical protein